MGPACSRKKSRPSKTKGKVQDDKDHDDLDASDLMNELVDEELNNLRYWLWEDLDMFVITNVLMSVQFFQNYEKDIEDLRKERRSSEGHELNGHRIKHFKADNVMELIGKYLVFRPQHGDHKNHEELFHPLRSFFLYQNVLVESEQGQSNNTSFEKKPPFYQLRVDTLNDDEETKRLHKAGFVNLKEILIKEEDKIYESIDESPKSSRRSSISSAHHTQYGNTMRRNTLGILAPVRRLSHLQVNKPQDDPYGYVTIQKITSPKYIQRHPINYTSPTAAATATCTIPQTTFARVERQILENARRTGKQGSLINVYGYLNSTKFYNHFVEILYSKLADCLDIETAIENAKDQGQRVVVKDHIVTHHLMPAFNIRFWPNPTAQVKMNQYADDEPEPALWQIKQPNAPHWPTDYMEKRIKKMGLYLLPLGYLKRRGFNHDFELQWQYICPRGEDYLLTHIMHSQMRCFLFILALIKAFVPEDNTIIGLNHTHIMHLLFWKIHKDCQHWPDDRPADSLIRLLKALQKAINKREIKDFFIPSRNILESSPILFLNKAEAVINKILENPLPYVLLAVKHLRMRPSFYPTLDVTKIYQILTVKSLNGYLHPQMASQNQPKVSEFDSDANKDYYEDDDNSDNDDGDDTRLWKIQYHRQQQKEKAAKEQMMKRASTDTIQLSEKVKVTRQHSRRKEIIKIFIDHFLKMSETSRRFRSFDQSLIYTLQASRLLKLLAQINPVDLTEIKQYEEKIAKEEINTGEDKFKSNHKTVDTPVNTDNLSDKKRLSFHSRALPQTPDAETANIPKPLIQGNQTNKSS